MRELPLASEMPTPTQAELDAEARAWGFANWATFAEWYIRVHTFCERNEVATFATSPDGSVVACSFKPKRRS